MKDRYRSLIIILFVVVAIVAFAGGAGLRYVSQKTRTSAKDLVFTKPFGGRDTFTVLVLGEDETFTKDKSIRGRTDTIMVGVVDVKNHRARGLSIPRDTRVKIPNKDGHYKINAAYVFGGPQLTAQTVADLLGIPIDYYVKTNISGLKSVVDIVGGIEIDIEKDMRYTDRRGGLFINLKKGYRHLDGDKALQYVRFRHDAMGDLWRVERQQKFMRALAFRMNAPENWTKLPQAIDEIMKNIETNMTGKDLIALARLSKHIPMKEISLKTLPGVPQVIGGASYYVADANAIPGVVDEIFRFQDPKPLITVLNGCGITGAAEKLADVLREQGYIVARTGNAKRLDYTQSVVLAKDPANNQSRVIADMLNCTPTPIESDLKNEKASIVIIVGRDYL